MTIHWGDPLLSKLTSKYHNPLEHEEEVLTAMLRDINILKSCYMRVMGYMAMKDITMTRKDDVEMFLQNPDFAEDDFVKEALNVIQSVKIRCAIY